MPSLETKQPSISPRPSSFTSAGGEGTQGTAWVSPAVGKAVVQQWYVLLCTTKRGWILPKAVMLIPRAQWLLLCSADSNPHHGSMGVSQRGCCRVRLTDNSSSLSTLTILRGSHLKFKLLTPPASAKAGLWLGACFEAALLRAVVILDRKVLLFFAQPLRHCNYFGTVWFCIAQSFGGVSTRKGV